MSQQRIDLRAYQESIAARLAAAAGAEAEAALLGFAAAGRHWLVDLPAAGEVMALPPLAPVPLTHDWCAGLAAIHGELQVVVDFAAFCGGAPAPRSAATRLLHVGARHGTKLALLVERVHGLKRPADFAPAAADVSVRPWHDGACTDAQGKRWTRLDIARLLADPALQDAALREI